MRSCVAFLFVFLLTSHLCISVSWATTPQNIRFQHLNLEQGLSQETVQAIWQDSQGYMWFGTQEGLNRFDGYQFKVFTHNDADPHSLGNDWIFSIAEGPKGNIWVGTPNGISVFDVKTEHFNHYHHDPTNPDTLSGAEARVLFLDNDKNLWIGTNNGLSRYFAHADTFVRYENLPGIDGRELAIRSINQDEEGNIWIGTDGLGVFHLSPRNSKITPLKELYPVVEKLSQRVMTIEADQNNRLWFGFYDNGAAYLNLQTGELREFSPESERKNRISDGRVRDAMEDQDGNVWLATDNGLELWSDTQQRFIHIVHEAQNRYSLSSNKLTRLFQDRGGVFWIGGYSGLNKWNTSTAKFAHYRVLSDEAISLSHSAINGFAQTTNQDVWVATFGGLNRINPVTGQIVKYLADQGEIRISSNAVMSIIGDDDGTVWLGTRSKGLDHFDPNKGVLKNYRAGDGGLSGNAISALHLSGEHQVWIGVYTGGVNLLNSNTGEIQYFRHSPNNPNSLSSDRVVSLFEDSQGQIWVGTDEAGLNLLDPKTGHVKRILHRRDDLYSLSSDRVWSVHEDQQGNIWVGTGGGLNKLSSQYRESGQFVFERVGRHQGLPSSNVYGILEDEQGELWLSTNRGLSKFDPVTGKILNYDSSHGLQGNDFNLGAYLKDAQGRMWFGGNNGVTNFFPSDITPNAHVPPVVLTRFLKLNEALSPDERIHHRDSIQIGYEDYLIAFEFAGLDYAAPGSNQYRYMLEGFDQDWIDAGDLRRATYSNLPAGNYLFKVRASNNDGVWNEDGTEVAVNVLPAPWFSWWAYLGYFVVTGMVLFSIIRASVNKYQQQQRYQRKLEQEVSHRTAELRELNEQLLSASMTDQLTGLHNRRYLSSTIENACATILRDNRDAKQDNYDSDPRLFFLMFDLDGFKPINDNYGHDAGDRIIQQVAHLLRHTCRESDTLIRWGGDEFLIMGRVEEMHEIEVLTERLRKAIADNAFDIGIKKSVSLSCSMGYSCYPYSSESPELFTWEQVQTIADRALYCSKEAGRNQWTGLISSTQKPPLSMINQLSNQLPELLEKKYVRKVTVIRPTGSKSPGTGTL